MEQKTMKNLIFISIISLIFMGGILIMPVFASITNGIIDSTYKYAWGENIGWLNFDCDNCGVHITDSGLSGYALGENTGWIYLSDITNDGEGNLSGLAWGENVGWINFYPDKSRVIINSSGEFTGSALGENTGWIIFNCATSACVKTDWRPQSARPACNNATDDDGDGKIDYPNDPGCDSLTDTDETDPAVPAPSGGGGGSTCVGPRTFSDSLVINQGQEYTQTKEVKLSIKADSALYMSICDNNQFIGCLLESYSTTKSWILTEGEGQKTAYAVFVSNCGANSLTVSDTIILDTIVPEIKITEVKDYYSPAEDVVLTAETEAKIEVILHWDEKYGLIRADEQGKLTINLGKMSAGTYQLEIITKDSAGNKGEPLIIELTIKSLEIKEEAEKPKEVEEVPEAVPEIAPEKPKKPIIEKVPEILKPLIPEFLKPGEKEEEKPEGMIVIPEEAPLTLQGKWDLLSPKAIGGFVLSPLPKEIRVLAKKFPELGKTLEEVGVSKITDVEKLKTAKLTLPGLTERVGLPTTKIEPGKFALPQGVPVVELSAEVKEQIPSEIVFAKTGGELIDFNIALSVTEKGKAEQKITTISGKPLNLTVKPEKPVKTIKGYIIFKAKKTEPSSFQLPLNSLVASLFFANPVFAQPQTQPVEVEEALVLMEFEYTDPDGDGIYTADIQAPLVEGEYEIITVMDYEDPDLGQKEIRLITVVDPEGYVYEKTGDKETRIPGAIISLFWLNTETKQYELWPAKEYRQENPQITDTTGKYAFLVPNGSYYLKVEAPGYLAYDGKAFQVTESSGIHINVELKTKYWWLKIVDWKTLILILVILFLAYNFYRDRIRERRPKKVAD